jgi:hypothetical protein
MLTLPFMDIISADRYPDSITNEEVVEAGHEIGTHGTEHLDTRGFTVEQARAWAEESVFDIERSQTRTSRWGMTCLSIAYPYSSTNINVITASYEAGLRIGGQCQNIQSQGTFWDSPDVPIDEMDWMNLQRSAGKATKGFADVELLRAVEAEGSFADAMFHAYDKLDPEFMDYLDSSKTVWHATWGEVRSYHGLAAAGITITSVNASAQNRTVVYSVKTPVDTDLRLWDVPVTLTFRLKDQSISSEKILYKNQGAEWTELKDITGEQSMTAGYSKKDDFLYISLPVKDTDFIINEGYEYTGVAKWWNNLSWAAGIHVDDITSLNFKTVLEYYNDQNHLQPLTFMAMGYIQWPLTDISYLENLMFYGCGLVAVISMGAAVVMWYRTKTFEV